MSVVLAIAALALAGEPSLAERQSRAFEEKVLEELAARAPGALGDGRAAAEAYRAGRWQEAFDAYGRVLAAAPDFPHAVRRQCGVRRELGDRAAALPLCRSALALAATPENRLALASTLAWRGVGRDPPAGDLAEAGRLARQALDERPGDVATAWITCQVALHAADQPLAIRAAERALALAPGEVASEYCGVFGALLQGDHGEARRHLRVARAAGLPGEPAERLEELIGRSEPAWRRYGVPALWVVGGWAVLLGLLLLAGVALSAATLRNARRIATRRDGTGAEGAGLRKVYRVVLWLTCAVYYLSLPIVLLVVVAGAYALWLGFAAIGRIPVKLALIVGLAVLVSFYAVAKSLWASLVRGKAGDPGLRLDVAAQPRFGAALAEAAARVGTRPVDKVFLTPGTDAAVYEDGGMTRQLAGRTGRCLVLGIGLLEGMTQGQLKAVLAHEYGHFVNRDTAGGGLALAVRRSILQMAQALAAGGAATWYNPAWHFVRRFHALFLRVSQGASRLQEILADRWSALAYGGARFGAGLRHAIERSVRFDAHARVSLQEVVDAKLGLANLYRFVPSASPPSSEVDAEVERALAAEPSPYDSHPRPLDRIAWVADVAPAEEVGASADAPAWELFEDREALERRLTDEVRKNVAENHGIAIPAEATSPPQTASPGG